MTHAADTDTTYNGWKNYETWAVGMYLDGNYDGEGTYRAVLDIVRQAIEEGDEDTLLEPARARSYAVENALKMWASENIEGEVECGIASDLLSGALSEVDWQELAEHKIQEVSEND